MNKLKNVMKPTLNVILLSLYLMMVWTTYIYIFVTDMKSYLLPLLLFMGIVVYAVSSIVLSYVKKMQFPTMEEMTFKRKAMVFGLTTFISFGIMMIWYIAYYPGAFSPDSITQYGQAVAGSYNDWHPVWHTLVFFTLPLKLTGQVSAIVLFQMIYFSLAMGYMGMVLSKRAGVGCTIVVEAYILLTPFTASIILYPWKDVGFAIAALLAMCMMTEIFFTEGEWAGKWWRCILLGLALANATLFRHNAILFTAFALIALIFHMNKKRWMIVAVTMVAFVVAIRGPVYHFLQVEDPGSRTSECMGVPLTVIGNVAKETPEAFDEEMAEFAFSIASPEDWQNYYQCGNFNSIKWDAAELTVVDDTSPWKILQITAKCFARSHKSSLRALFALTDMVYGLEVGLEGDFVLEITENHYGISYAGNEELAAFLQTYKALMSQTIFKYFRNIGFTMVLMLIAMLGRSNLRKWADWKKIFLCLPIFAYNFGTMLLLTGPDSRFFYVSFLVCPLVICVSMKQREE